MELEVAIFIPIMSNRGLKVLIQIVFASIRTAKTPTTLPSIIPKCRFRLLRRIITGNF